MTAKIFVFVALFVLSMSPVEAQEKYFVAAPSQLPSMERTMKTAGFWISRHPSPDELVMDAVKIDELNAHIQNDLKLTKDLAAMPETFSGEEFSKILRDKFDEIKTKDYFLRSGEKPSPLLLQDLEASLNLTSIPNTIEPSFGFVLRYTDQRFLPTGDGFFEQAGDFDFDQLQNNALETATPVVILHKSFDGAWLYVLAPSSDGWVKSADIVSCALKDVQEYAAAATFVVVTKPKADVFFDQALGKFYDYVQMGARLLKEKKQDSAQAVAVKIPFRRDDGRFVMQTFYLDPGDVNDGYLPYTPRVIYKQAFALLNAPYGWGGMYGEQDCSRFVQEIFATVGIRLPRDSKDQAKVGLSVASFDFRANDEQRLKSLAKARGAVSVLTLKGHIMLYLGSVDGKPYAIHAVWAYREPDAEEDRVRVINRVVVSGLDLGEGSKKGSLLKRLTGIKQISK